MSTIIIEGPDGAGKTRLLRALLDKYPEYRAAPRACSSVGGPLDSSSMAVYLDKYGHLDKHIYDRHPSISGAVYDAAIARTQPDNVGVYLQESFYWILGNAKVIYCRPPMGVIVKAVYSEPQMAGVVHNICQIVDIYDSLMVNLIPHERYDWTKDDLPSL